MAWMAGMPRAQAVLAGAGRIPKPITDSIPISAEWFDRQNEEVYHWRSPRMLVRKEGPNMVSLFLDHVKMAQPAECEIIGPDGKVYRQESWQPPRAIAIAADAPDGVYPVQVQGAFIYPPDADPSQFRRGQGDVFFPLSGPDIPEVMELTRTEAGTSVPASESGWWFQVPEGTDSFWIEFPSGNPAKRLSVWNPEGGRAWDGYPSTEEARRIQIKVPSGQAGQLWRVTGTRFVIDPAIPPIFSASRVKWFDPKAGR